MIDFTELAQAITSLAFTAITLFLIPGLRERYGNEICRRPRAGLRLQSWLLRSFTVLAVAMRSWPMRRRCWSSTISAWIWLP